MFTSAPAKANFLQVPADVRDQNQSIAFRRARTAALLETTGGPFVDSDRSMLEGIMSLARHVTMN